MYYVYVLRSLKTQEFYKGITSNIDRRFKKHTLGETRSTKYKRPLELIHVEMCNSRIEARKIEKFLKSGYGREIIKEIAGVVELVDT